MRPPARSRGLGFQARSNTLSRVASSAPGFGRRVAGFSVTPATSSAMARLYIRLMRANTRLAITGAGRSAIVWSTALMSARVISLAFRSRQWGSSSFVMMRASSPFDFFAVVFFW